MKQIRVFSIALIMLTALLGLWAVHARAASGIVSVRSVTGSVETQAKVDAEWKSAKAGDTLGNGARIRTGKGGEAMLAWPQGHVVKVFQLTSLTIESATSDANREDTQLKADSGKVFSRVKALTSKDSTFKIRTPSALAGVRGTEFMVEIVDDKTSKFSLLEGKLDIVTDTAEMVLEQNMQILLEAGMAAPEPIEIPDTDRMEMQSISSDMSSDMGSSEAPAAAPTQTSESTYATGAEISDSDIVQQNLDYTVDYATMEDLEALLREYGVLPPMPPSVP